MAYYIQHLYGGKLLTHLMSDAPNCESDNHPYVLLARMYVLGERMLDPKFQNVVIHELFRLARLDKTGTPHKHTGLLPCHSHINVIYQGTTSKSPARRMMVDIATAYDDELWFVSLDLDPAFLFDLSKSLLRKVADYPGVVGFRWATLKATDYLVSEKLLSLSVERYVIIPDPSYVSSEHDLLT
jgi:hypothetical protein